MHFRRGKFADKPVAVGDTGGERLFKDVQKLAREVSRVTVPLQLAKTTAPRRDVVFSPEPSIALVQLLPPPLGSVHAHPRGQECPPGGEQEPSL